MGHDMVKLRSGNPIARIKVNLFFTGRYFVGQSKNVRIGGARVIGDAVANFVLYRFYQDYRITSKAAAAPPRLADGLVFFLFKNPPCSLFFTMISILRASTWSHTQRLENLRHFAIRTRQIEEEKKHDITSVLDLSILSYHLTWLK